MIEGYVHRDDHDPHFRVEMLVVNVRREEIERGQPESCTRCPIALAIGRVMTEAVEIEVNILRANLIVLIDDVQWVTTRDVCSWAMRFDAGLPLEPITFSAGRLWG